MKQVLKRMTALTLALAMSMSLLCSTAWAAEENDAFAEERMTETEILTETVEDAVEDAVESDVEEVTEAAEEDIPEAEETETPAEETAPVEEIPAEEVETTTISALSVEETLFYDDHITLDTAFGKKYKGYTVQSITNQNVTSYQTEISYDTSSGIREAKHAKDEAVLKQKDSTLVAVGTGTADMTLSNGSETVVLTVTVKPAPLTLMYLTGQSNMEGRATLEKHYVQDSVACAEGQVYSTYLSSNWKAPEISGHKYTDEVKDVTLCVPASLTGTKNRKGTELQYPLNALTTKGSGKTGMDSALAYEWNRLTGEKVWVINTAVGGTASAMWIPGGSCYNKAAKTMELTKKTVETEVAVGHYTVSRSLMFWMQGEDSRDWKETDTDTPTVQRYVSNFNAMLKGFEEVLSKTGAVEPEGNIDVKELDLSIQKIGIIPTRSGISLTTNKDELAMTCSRLAHYYMARSSAYPDIFMVTNQHEQWVTDAGVKNYFTKAYPNGKFTYPLRSNTTLSRLPTTVDEIHADIHFSQCGHNENGLTAARGMYQVVRGEVTLSGAYFRDYNGNRITSLGLQTGKHAIVTLEGSPVTCAKQMQLQYDKTGLAYDEVKGVVTRLKDGDYTIKAVADGKTVATLTVTAPKPAVPTLKNAVNASNGIVFSWNKAANAAKYAVYRKEGSGSYKKIATTTAVSYTDKSVTNGTLYTYTVRGVNGSEVSGYKTGKAVIRVTGVALSSVKNAKKQKMTVKWKKNAKATGYQVQYSVNSNFFGATTKTYKKAATVSATITGLKKGKTYYVRVRAYRTASGVTSYSAWSGSKKVKISK